jgi:serine/threonine-protein kinase
VKPGDALAGARKATFGDVLAELKRRRVFRVMVGYGIFAFAVLQISEPVMHGAHLPEWVLTAILLALAAGFPVSLLLAWLFDLTGEGVKRTPSPSGPGAVSFSRGGLAALLVVVGTLAAAPGVAWHLWKQSGERGRGSASAGAMPSIAVLPFADMSPGKDQEYFADGMAEEVLDKLAHVRGLKVIGRTSSFSFKGKGDDLRVIGQKLGAGNVLEGSVRKSGTRVRITAQLVETADGSHLWSETFDRELTDVFAVQNEIARAVVDALRVKLLPGQAPPAGEYRPASPEAYQSYLLGKHFSNGFSRDAQQRAVTALQKAVELDPAYPPAWAALSRSRLSAGVLGAIPWPEARRASLSDADRAVDLAPDLPEALAARARARLAEWDWTGARADVTRALERGPEDPQAISAMAAYLYWTGRHSEQVAWSRRLVEKEPLDGSAWNSVGVASWFAGRFEEADRAFARAIEVDPENAFAPANRATALVDAGRAAEGLALCPAAIKGISCRAFAYHALGDAAAAQRELDAMLAGELTGDRMVAIASIHAVRGQADQAFEWLDRAVAEHARALNGLQGISHFRSLRADPRYAALLRKMNLPAN